MLSASVHRVVVCTCGCVVALTGAACGGGDSPPPTNSLRAGAVSLQQAMDASARSIEALGATSASRKRLAAILRSAISQTGDVIELLTPAAASDPTATMLVAASRAQRSFLQFAAESIQARSRTVANGALDRARDAGRRASAGFAAITRESTVLAGLLPASTTFNTGPVRNALRHVNPPGDAVAPPSIKQQRGVAK